MVIRSDDHGDTQSTKDTTAASRQDDRQPQYAFLVRLSRRMGGVATRSFVEVREFLNREIVLPPVDTRRLPTMPLLKKLQQRTQGERQSTGQDNTLEEVVRRSSEVLTSANTVFPLTLFPDTVIVDRAKVTIIRRDFLWSSDTISFRIEDVLNVSATVGPLFGSLTIASRVMSTTDHFQIKHLWRNDAVYLKHIIQGYVIAQHNGIDVANLSKDDLIKTLSSLGHE